MTGQYAGFVLAAYGIGAASLLALVAWAVLDRKGARAGLERIERAAARTERQGVRTESAGGGEGER